MCYFALLIPKKSSTFADMKCVFATNNAHKLAEARDILAQHVDVISLADIHCQADIPETADTLEGNSRLKARYIWEYFGANCFADDTGLEIMALGGAPGVYSARYASLDSAEPIEKDAVDAANRAKVLRLLQGTEDRRARFRTVITLIINGKEQQFEGEVRGMIAHAESGTGGFGYDAIFIPEGYTKTFACLSPVEKNSISHRGRALENMRRALAENK